MQIGLLAARQPVEGVILAVSGVVGGLSTLVFQVFGKGGQAAHATQRIEPGLTEA